MGEVKPAEVSAILRKQLSGFNTESKLEEIGTVLQVGDGIARIYGLNNAQSGDWSNFKTAYRQLSLTWKKTMLALYFLGLLKESRRAILLKEQVKSHQLMLVKGCLEGL